MKALAFRSLVRWPFRLSGGLMLLLAAGMLPLAAVRAQEADEDKPVEETVVEEQAVAEQPVEAFNEGMQQLAAEVAKFLEQHNEKSLIVGPFTGPPATGGGPGIVQGIKENLPEKIDTTAKLNVLGLSGTYRLSKDKSSGRNCIVVEASIKDALGNPRLDITRYILTDEQSVQRLMAGNSPLPVTAPPGQTLDEARDEALLAGIKQPAFTIGDGGDAPSTDPAQGAQSIVRLPGTGFGVEILVLQNGEYVPRAAVDQGGLPFVELAKDEIYAVRLINDGPGAAGAAVFIDGVNSLAFSPNPAFREVGKWVVRPGSTDSLVKGWHVEESESASFQVTDYGDSVVGRAGIVGSAIGTVSVQFFAAFTDDKPLDEPELLARPRGDLATGEGPLVGQNARPMQMNFGVSRGQISIRYTREHAGDLPQGTP